MKKLLMVSTCITLLSLTACSKMPKACVESWEKMEKLAEQMGLPEEQLKGSINIASKKRMLASFLMRSEKLDTPLQSVSFIFYHRKLK